MLITERFLKDIPAFKKAFILNKIEKFSLDLADSFGVHDMPNGFWVRKVSGTDIYKFRVNNGDRILFTYKQDRGEKQIVFLRYCNHDEQIRQARGQQNSVSSLKSTDFNLVVEVYEETESDREFEREYDQYAQEHAFYNLSDLAALVLEDEYIAMLLDEDHEDYLYYLNDDQYDCLKVFDKPLFVNGSAGSGKSMIGVRKLLLNHQEDIRTLYITRSNLLKEQTRTIFERYKSNDKDASIVHLSTLNEYGMRRLTLTPMQVVQFQDFNDWYQSASKLEKGKTINTLQVWFEISGIIKGSGASLQEPTGLLAELDYIAQSQSALSKEQKQKVYRIAKRYQKWLELNQLVDENDLAKLVIAEQVKSPDQPYDYVVIDEVQDLSEIQLVLLMTLAKREERYMLLGDFNQNIYSGQSAIKYLKSLFFEARKKLNERTLSKNYRNGSEIVHFVNQLTDLRTHYIGKNAHDLRETSVRTGALPFWIQYAEPEMKRLFEQMNEKDYCAIVVADSEERDRLQLSGFPVNRVFTVHEIKGLEYKTVLMYNIMSRHADFWRLITDGQAQSNDFYRFFFNLFYVAATRAKEQLCIFEERGAPKMMERLMPFLEILTRFDPAKLQIEKETTIQAWKKEAARLEKSELYKKAADIYRRLGDSEGEQRCEDQIKLLSVHYWNDMLGVRTETAIRIEREDGNLSVNDIYQALMRICLMHSVTVDHANRIQAVAQSRDGLGGSVADIRVSDERSVLAECARIAHDTMAQSDRKPNKVTVHAHLISGGKEILITNMDGEPHDTLIAVYRKNNLHLQYANTKNKAVALMIEESFPEAAQSFRQNEDWQQEALMRHYVHQANQYYEHEQYARAIEEYHKALELIEPKNKDKRADIVGAIGNAYLQKENYQEAEYYLRQAIEQKTQTMFEPCNSLGVIKLRQGKWNEAIAWFNKAIRSFPTYQPAQDNLQLALRMQRKEGIKGAMIYKQSVGRNDPCPCGSGKKYKKCCLK